MARGTLQGQGILESAVSSRKDAVFYLRNFTAFHPFENDIVTEGNNVYQRYRDQMVFH